MSKSKTAVLSQLKLVWVKKVTGTISQDQKITDLLENKLFKYLTKQISNFSRGVERHYI